MQNYHKDGDFGILLLRWLVILFHLQLQGKDETLTHGKIFKEMILQPALYFYTGNAKEKFSFLSPFTRDCVKALI